MLLNKSNLVPPDKLGIWILGLSNPISLNITVGRSSLKIFSRLANRFSIGSINPELFYFLLFAIILCAVLVCYFATKDLVDEEKDQKSIVIDELAGVWIAFIPVSGIVMMQDFLTYSILAFLVFRVFDIWKPYPIGLIDKKIKNYLGVVLDDLVAGLYAAITIWLILILF